MKILLAALGITVALSVSARAQSCEQLKSEIKSQVQKQTAAIPEQFQPMLAKMQAWADKEIPCGTAGAPGGISPDMITSIAGQLKKFMSSGGSS